MDRKAFRECGRKMIDYVTNYAETITERDVFPKVSPGYLHKLIPTKAPENSENWEDIMEDVEHVIMPGVTHWKHPHFFAYFAGGNSYPALCGDILSGGIGCISFTWVSSPACTELKVVMMDWLAQMLQLPDYFMSGGEGGGIIQEHATRQLKSTPGSTIYEAMSKLVGYCSDQAHSSVEKAGLLGMIPLKKIRSDSKRRMRGEDLREAILEDIANGKVPFFCVASLDTTSSCAFDPLLEIGPVCEEFDVWLHIDAAYAGSAFICPEFRPLLDGVEYATSFVFNPHKWLLVTFDCSCVWFRKTAYISDAFCVDPLYLQHKHQGDAPDFRHWEIPLGRRFRSLKVWFVLRTYGVTKLQEYIRNGDNQLAKDLYESIEADGRIHLVPAEFSRPKMFFLRLAVVNQFCNEEHISFAYRVISELLTKLLEKRDLTNGCNNNNSIAKNFSN